MKPYNVPQRPKGGKVAAGAVLLIQMVCAGLLVGTAIFWAWPTTDPASRAPRAISPDPSMPGWSAMRGAGVEQIGTMPARVKPTAHVDTTPKASASPRPRRVSVTPATAKPKPTPTSARGTAGATVSRKLTGLATWYPGTRGFIGRATVALPPPSRYTGGISGYVRVCILSTGRCARLPVVDCLCAHAAGVIVDLSLPTLPLLHVSRSAGVYRVSVARVP